MEWRQFASEAWSQLEPLARRRPGTMAWHHEMTGERFERFVEVAWYASMLTEERRTCCSRLVLGRSARPSIPFASPMPYDEQTVAKLSPMVNRGLRQLVVHPTDTGLSVVGIRDPFFRYRRWLSALPEAHHPDNHLMLRIVAPGHIRLGYPVEQELRLGKVHFLTPLSKVQAFEPWFAQFGADLDGRAGAEKAAPGLFAVQRIWTEILRQVVDAEQGGTFLIVPDEAAAMKALLPAAPPTRCDTTILADTLREMRAIEPGLPAYAEVTGEHNARLINMAHFHERDQSLATQMVASLTAVDGAVILLRSMKLIAFAAKIAAEPTLDVREHLRRAGRVQVLPWEGLAKRGSRHHSAVNFVAAVPGSIAIVISTDGDISVFSGADDHVSFERVTLNEDWHDVEQ